MKESKWLASFAKKVDEKRNQSNQKKKVIFILLPIMMLVMLIPVIAGIDMSNPEMKIGIYAMVGTFVFVILLLVLLLGKGKKIVASAATRENVMGLLKSDEEVDSFDEQMRVAPLRETKMGATSRFFVTNDYIGLTFLHLGDEQYRFARISDINTVETSKTSSAGVNPLSASYFFSIKDDKNKIMIQGVAESRTMLEGMLTIINEIKPNTRIIV